MKKMQGIVDPISLTFVLLLGMAAAVSMTEKDVSGQQLAENTPTELSASAEAAHLYLASK